MMHEVRDALLAVSGSPAAAIVVKATIVAAVGLIAARVARGRRAAVRHALLAGTFAAMAVLPAVSLLAPPIRIALETPAPPAAPVRAPAAEAAAGAAPGESAPVPVEPRPERLTPAVALLLTWGAGAAFFMILVIAGGLRVRMLRRTGLPWPRGEATAEGLTLRAGMARRVEVFMHEALPEPMACGALRPAIALPVDAREWDEEDLSRALVHELEHVRRGDWPMLYFARVVCAAYWFHPLAWMAWRRLALEAEHACDDAVLARFEATAYADQLVGLAGRMAAAARSPLPAMASRADLSKRVRAVLDARRRRGRAGAGPVAAVSAGAVALTLLIAPLATVAAPQPMEAGSTHFAALAPTPAPRPVVEVPVRRRDTPAAASQDGPALLAMAAQPPAPQSQGAPAAPLASLPQFRAESQMVIVNVAAHYPNGTSIGGLTAGDFTVTEDGAPQTIKVFEYQMVDSASQGGGASPSSYYVLGYYTANTNLDGTYRRIEVALKGLPDAKVDCRTGYTSPDIRRMEDDFRQRLGGRGQAQAAAQAAGPTLPAGVTLPQLLHKAEPEYSEEARRRKFQGTVVMRITVEADGTVGDVTVVRSLGMGLDDKAVQAVKMWRYTPGTQNGIAVAMQAVVEADFRLF